MITVEEVLKNKDIERILDECQILLKDDFRKFEPQIKDLINGLISCSENAKDSNFIKTVSKHTKIDVEDFLNKNTIVRTLVHLHAIYLIAKMTITYKIPLEGSQMILKNCISWGEIEIEDSK